jgi:chorismate--pyruvate lyase
MLVSFPPASRDRRWRRGPAGADARWRSWLTHRGLLTRRIEPLCTAFSVRVLFQGAAGAVLDERWLAGHRERRVLAREVFLDCGGMPVVYAHSIVRLRHLRGPWRALSTLGSRPLGAALFDNPRVRRHPPRFRKLNAGDALHAKACAAAGQRLPALWARRSLYVLRGAPILVTEVFLPALLELSEA